MLYKYLPPQRAHIIFDGKIRFSQPCALNDPFESEFLIETREHNEEYLRLHEENMKKIVAEQNEDLNNPFVQASYTAAVNQVRAFILQKSYPPTVGREFAKSMNQRQGVLSLSRTNNNILMWSHYADSHKGIVLGLDETHDFFSGVDRMGLKRPPRNVVYSTKRQLVKAGDTQAFEKLMCQKSLDWAYEEEVRLFRAFGTDDVRLLAELTHSV